MPSMKSLQVGSIHHYKENFSRAFGIKYEGIDGKHYYCHQTTYGMSERVLGAIIGLHGDEKGIKLPSSIAPIQVIIIPILFKGWKERIIEECKHLDEKLKEIGIRSFIDAREDKTPGSKFFDWEIKGVPIRVEIGPNDIEKGILTVVARDGVKKTIPKEDIKMIRKEMEEYDKRIYKMAKKFLKENIHRIKEKEDGFLEGIIEIPWCGKEECGKKAEEKFGMKSLGIALEENCNEKCFICDGKGVSWLRLSKSY